MKTAYDVAQFFLNHTYDGEKDQISNLKLQKLLYYAQGYALALLDKPLFAEPIKCWKHGPVIESVYHDYKHFAKNPIQPAKNFDINVFKRDEIIILTRVANQYGQYSAWKLRDMTHNEAPWCDAYYANTKVISNSDIKLFFTRLLSPVYSCDDRHAYQYDINALQDSIDSGSVPVPKLKNDEDFITWLNA